MDPRTRTSVRVIATIVLVAAALALVCGVPSLVYQGVTATLYLFGGGPEPADRARDLAEQSRYYRWALVVTLAATSLGAIAAGVLGRWRSCVLLVVLLLGSAVGVALSQVDRAAEPPQRDRVICQERSGGDSDCPGG